MCRFVFSILGITVKTVKHLFTDSLCCQKKKKGGLRWGKDWLVVNTNRPSKGTRFKVWNAMSAQRSVKHKLFFHSVQGCHNLLLKGLEQKTRTGPKKTEDVQLFSSAGFICFLFTFIETGLFCGLLFESWLVTHSKFWAIGRKH